jgi:hypothetical protein
MSGRTLRFTLREILVWGAALAILAFSLGAVGHPVMRVQALPPYIEALTPDNGPVGTKVIITGLNFTGASRVIFSEGHSANFQLQSDTEVWASVPPGAISGPVSVETPAGTARSRIWFRIPIP